jgi:hypothetical protein
MTNEDFPPPPPDEPLPPEDADLDARSQPIDGEPDETYDDEPDGDDQPAPAGPGGPLS